MENLQKFTKVVSRGSKMESHQNSFGSSLVLSMKMIRADFGRPRVPRLRVVVPRTDTDVLLLAAVQVDLIHRSLGAQNSLKK